MWIGYRSVFGVDWKEANRGPEIAAERFGRWLSREGFDTGFDPWPGRYRVGNGAVLTATDSGGRRTGGKAPVHTEFAWVSVRKLDVTRCQVWRRQARATGLGRSRPAQAGRRRSDRRAMVEGVVFLFLIEG